MQRGWEGGRVEQDGRKGRKRKRRRREEEKGDTSPRHLETHQVSESARLTAWSPFSPTNTASVQGSLFQQRSIALGLALCRSK